MRAAERSGSSWLRFVNASPQFARAFPPMKARANKIFKILKQMIKTLF